MLYPSQITFRRVESAPGRATTIGGRRATVLNGGLTTASMPSTPPLAAAQPSAMRCRQLACFGYKPDRRAQALDCAQPRGARIAHGWHQRAIVATVFASPRPGRNATGPTGGSDLLFRARCRIQEAIDDVFTLAPTHRAGVPGSGVTASAPYSPPIPRKPDADRTDRRRRATHFRAIPRALPAGPGSPQLIRQLNRTGCSG